MGKQTLRIARPADRIAYPLIADFIRTDEPGNPWRCESCATQAQRRRAVPASAIGQDPRCCRTCGLDYA